MPINPTRCQGWRRYGGAFTLGPVRWEQCKEKPTVMLRFKDKEDGKVRTMPACQKCWQECIDTGVKILKATPIKPKKGQKNE
jgi:hypothetical protein